MPKSKLDAIKEMAKKRVERDNLTLGPPDYTSQLPPPVVEEYDGIMVVRDDLLDGGSKRRFCERFVRECKATELVCGGINLYGKAQEALALLCRDSGKACTLFIPKRNEMLPLTKKAVEYGANIKEVANGRITVCTARARKYAAEKDFRLAMPMGLDHPLIIAEIGRLVREQIEYVPTEVWSVVSSGTLTRGLQAAWPDATFYGVQTGHSVKPHEAGRLARLYIAPEKYNEKATGELPPFPSLSEYDAKVWRFIKQYASPGALFWNVA